MALKGFPHSSVTKESAHSAGDLGSILGWEDPLQKGKATHSSILAWRIPWTVHGVAKSQTRLSDFYYVMALKKKLLLTALGLLCCVWAFL